MRSCVPLNGSILCNLKLVSGLVSAVVGGLLELCQCGGLRRRWTRMNRRAESNIEQEALSMGDVIEYLRELLMGITIVGIDVRTMPMTQSCEVI